MMCYYLNVHIQGLRVKLHYKIPEDQNVQYERRGNIKYRIYRRLPKYPD